MGYVTVVVNDEHAQIERHARDSRLGLANCSIAGPDPTGAGQAHGELTTPIQALAVG